MDLNKPITLQYLLDNLEVIHFLSKEWSNDDSRTISSHVIIKYNGKVISEDKDSITIQD